MYKRQSSHRPTSSTSTSCPRSGCSPRSGSRPSVTTTVGVTPAGRSVGRRASRGARAGGSADECRCCAAERPGSGRFGPLALGHSVRSAGRLDGVRPRGPGEGTMPARDPATRPLWSRSLRGRRPCRPEPPASFSVHTHPVSRAPAAEICCRTHGEPGASASVVVRASRYCGPQVNLVHRHPSDRLQLLSSSDVASTPPEASGGSRSANGGLG